jgi:hypothetical protein
MMCFKSAMGYQDRTFVEKGKNVGDGFSGDSVMLRELRKCL